MKEVHQSVQRAASPCDSFVELECAGNVATMVIDVQAKVERVRHDEKVSQIQIPKQQAAAQLQSSERS